MRKYLLLTFSASACLFLFSCKSKQILVERPPAGETAADTRLKDMQEDLPGTKVEQVDEGLKVTFDSNILFELNSSYLTGAAHEKLQSLTEALNKHPYSAIQIAGHTDNTGTEEYNKWLSERRAESVKTYLESLGVPAARMETAGYGESSPLAGNDSPEGQAKNRRVEVIISK
ncbi:MAG TPA: OmpA family protein [Anseongella sp.]|nr:OmpA family protein [Anseongella sp.]